MFLFENVQKDPKNVLLHQQDIPTFFHHSSGDRVLVCHYVTVMIPNVFQTFGQEHSIYIIILREENVDRTGLSGDSVPTVNTQGHFISACTEVAQSRDIYYVVTIPLLKMRMLIWISRLEPVGIWAVFYIDVFGVFEEPYTRTKLYTLFVFARVVEVTLLHFGI